MAELEAQHLQLEMCFILLLGLTCLHRPIGGGGQLSSASVSESVRPEVSLSSCFSGSSKSKGFFVAGMPATSSLRSRTLGSLELGGEGSIVRSPHNVRTLVRVGPAVG